MHQFFVLLELFIGNKCRGLLNADLFYTKQGGALTFEICLPIFYYLMNGDVSPIIVHVWVSQISVFMVTVQKIF